MREIEGRSGDSWQEKIQEIRTCLNVKGRIQQKRRKVGDGERDVWWHEVPEKEGGVDFRDSVGIRHQKEKGHFVTVLHSNTYLATQASEFEIP